MPLLSKEDRKQELEEISEFLNELEIAAVILPEGPWADQSGLLVELPTDEDVDWDAEELPENAHVAAAYLMQLDEESQDQLTKYLLFYFMMPGRLEDVDELTVLKLVNSMNQQVRMGSFFYGEGQGTEGPGKYIQYRLAVGASTDSSWDEGLVGEAIIEMGFYYDMMDQRLQELLSHRSLH